jgi:transglutaminase-like putative cysteine protease
LVFFVAIVKLLTARTRRDFLFLELIAFLELLAASVLSTNPSFFLFLVLFLFFAIGAFASGEIRRSASRAHPRGRNGMGVGRRLAWLTLAAGSAILLLTGALFFVLPRTARAALEKLAPNQARVSGFANELTLGQTGELRRQGGAVMHVRFDGSPPAGLLWRGNALAEFDGWKWYNTYAKPRVHHPRQGLLQLVDDAQRRRPGRRLNYEVVLHSAPSEAIFIAGLPEHLRIPAPALVETPVNAFKIPLYDAENFRYAVYSYLGEPAVAGAGDSQKLTEMERNHNLLLPPVDRRILALARQITAPYTDDYRRARAVENYLRTQYKYSLAPLEREPADPLAHFLFERREGHCEYYASAMAVMLRAVWVPARVATGFLGGTRNPISGWHVVRASDAHAWVEAWIPGRGWIAFDPTPPAPEASPLLAWSRLSLWADAFDTFWQEWVLGYDLDRQLTLAFQVDRGRRSISLRTAGNWWKELEARLKRGRRAAAGAAPWAALGLLLAAAAAFGGPWLLRRWRDRLRLRRWQRGEGSASDAALLYRRMLALLERQGHRKPPAQTPLEFARSLPEPALAKAVETFTRAYHELRYGGRPSQAARMAELLETLQPRRG